MRCPVCVGELVAQRTAAGDKVASQAGPRFLVSAPCPRCGTRLFAWTEGEAELPDTLVTRDGFLRWRTSYRRSRRNLADAVVAALFTLVVVSLVALGAWTLGRAFSFTTQTTGRLALASGPVTLLFGVVNLVGMLMHVPIRERARDRHLADRAPPGGLRLVAPPQAYRR